MPKQFNLRRKHFHHCLNVITFLLSILFFSFIPTRLQGVVRLQTGLVCDPQIYYGVQHCVDSATQANIVLVDLTDSHVHIQTVLPMGPSGECNSVNGSRADKDPTSNCPPSYPLETLENMLNRYKSSGAVAIINTDYFGCNAQYPCGGHEADHGAQGLAVRNGVQLSGPNHVAHTDPTDPKYLNVIKIAYTQPSLAFSPSNAAVIGTPGDQATIDNNLNTTYYNTVAGAPLIVQNGSAVTANLNCLDPYAPATPAPPGTPGICTKNNQSAGGLIGDRRLVLVTSKLNTVDTATFLTTNYHVDSALKFDGGGSAHLGWFDSAGKFQDYDPSQGNRPVAEGLLVFSSPIEPPLDQIVIPADGTSVQSNINLESNVTYSIVITGTYRYDVGEPGEFADAQYREDDNNQWTIRWNSVEFNGIRLTADRFDLTNHTYTFYVTGQGQHIAFRIYDEPGTYGDNEGSLTATIRSITTYSISGQVTDKKGQPISGVTISANTHFYTTTQNNVTYNLRGLPAGAYTLVPSKSNYSFTPPSLPVSVPPNTSTVNFNGTPNCPVIAALNPVNSDANRHSLGVADLISLYHQFRDDVLAPSAKGKEYIKDFEEQGSELSEILLTNSDLQTRTAQFLGNAMPAFGSLLPTATGDVVLSQTLYDEANVLVHDLANAGSQELHDKMLKIWEDLALDKKIGKAATEIWKQIQQSKIYLPLVSRQNPPSVIPFEINLSTNSQNEYRVQRSESGNGLAVGRLVYADRNYTYATIPPFLRGATYILTANNDAEKNNLAVNINVNRATQIYVAHSDQSATKPSWLNSFQDTGENLTFIDRDGRVVVLSVFTAVFPAGEILLGGNAPPSGGNHSMYTVVIK